MTQVDIFARQSTHQLPYLILSTLQPLSIKISLLPFYETEKGENPSASFPGELIIAETRIYRCKTLIIADCKLCLKFSRLKRGKRASKRAARRNIIQA
ncbi:hypothetical protein FGO68_gene730 [Halteria grandinella]|uniref:Uncharacterized protein n=1 Tax=Halteria grandinella TaxID=5974 RepID=A0A8J8NTI5_HALGN|nr:hypothetical protein FGO68_gene730 [Halteria grandinella]